MRVYEVEIREPGDDNETTYVSTLSAALKIQPRTPEGEDSYSVCQDSTIRSFEIAKGLTRKQLVFGILNQRGFARPGSHKTLRRWDGVRWVVERGN